VLNPYEFLVDLISFELREVLSMKEAIETREFYERKGLAMKRRSGSWRRRRRTSS